MQRHLVIVCGVPGAGKSTFAERLATNWSAATFASESFTRALGESARDATGDLTREAIAHAYSEMEKAVADAMKVADLTITVGAFRSAALRHQFRQLAAQIPAVAKTVRISCAISEAARRVRARSDQGDRGPAEHVITQIDAELARASDIDLVIENNSTIAQFLQLTDTFARDLMKSRLLADSTATLRQIPPR